MSWAGACVHLLHALSSSRISRSKCKVCKAATWWSFWRLVTSPHMSALPGGVRRVVALNVCAAFLLDASSRAPILSSVCHLFVLLSIQQAFISVSPNFLPCHSLWKPSLSLQEGTEWLIYYQKQQTGVSNLVTDKNRFYGGDKGPPHPPTHPSLPTQKKDVNLHGLLLNVKNWGCIECGSRCRETRPIDLVSKRIYLGNPQQMDQ